MQCCSYFQAPSSIIVPCLYKTVLIWGRHGKSGSWYMSHLIDSKPPAAIFDDVLTFLVTLPMGRFTRRSRVDCRWYVDVLTELNGHHLKQVSTLDLDRCCIRKLREVSTKNFGLSLGLVGVEIGKFVVRASLLTDDRSDPPFHDSFNATCVPFSWWIA